MGEQGRVISKLRREAGLTVEELGALAGLSPAMIYDFESGVSDLAPPVLTRLGEAVSDAVADKRIACLVQSGRIIAGSGLENITSLASLPRGTGAEARRILKEGGCEDMPDDFQNPRTTRENIVAARKLFGRSAEEVARAAGIDLDEYLKWEAGVLDFDDVDILARIERAAEGSEQDE